jgi:hypothetical protein
MTARFVAASATVDDQSLVMSGAVRGPSDS